MKSKRLIYKAASAQNIYRPRIHLKTEQRGEERGRREQMLSNIEMTLEMKFGSDGLQLMPQIEQISDLSSLKAILRDVIAASTFEEVQRLI